MNYDQYQGLIFDMDGTLLDTEHAHIKAWDTVLQRYGQRFDAAILAKCNGAPSLTIAKIILDLAPCPLTPEALVEQKIIELSQFLLQESRTLPLLEVVKHYHTKKPIALGTGSSRALTLSLLDHFEIRHYFTAIVTADDVSNHKPAPDTFLKGAQLMGVPPEQCLVFEDADFGIQAAQQANMDYIDVRTAFN